MKWRTPFVTSHRAVNWQSGERKHRFSLAASQKKHFTDFTLSRFMLLCFKLLGWLQVWPADYSDRHGGIWRWLPETTEEKGEDPLVCRQPVPVGRGKHKQSPLGMQGLCWPREELRLRRRCQSVVHSVESTIIFNERKKKETTGKQIAGINRAAHEHYCYAIQSVPAQTSCRVFTLAVCVLYRSGRLIAV